MWRRLHIITPHYMNLILLCYYFNFSVIWFIFRTLYTTFVRPHLEYAVSAWPPYLRRDIAMLESVQRRATKLVKQFKGLDYKTRFENLNLTALEDTRPKGDLIQYYKKYSGTNIINWHVAPTINKSNPCCIARSPPAKFSQREQFFTYRVIAPWKSLPHEIVEWTNSKIDLTNTFAKKNPYKMRPADSVE